MNIPGEAIEAAVNARGRLHNPKWDHPIMGYKTFSDDQKEFLREIASAMLDAAAPFIAAQALRSVADLLDAREPSQHEATVNAWWLRSRANVVEVPNEGAQP